MLSRRRFLGTAVAATALLRVPSSIRAASRPYEGLAPAVMEPSSKALAGEEAYWASIQQSFNIDRSLIHLNNGGVCPAPVFVQQAEQAHRLEANRAPFYAYRGRVRSQLESVRQGLADLFGCTAEEIALTRNTSEGMEICQLGFPLQRGDEVLTTEQDYPRMLNTWAQRARREGIIVKKVPLQVPLVDPEAFVSALEAAITPRTRLLMCCHMIDLTGQILPVRAISAMAHRQGIPVLVDGAQTFGHLPMIHADLACDFYATSLHKWMMGPQGTGMLFVRRDRLSDLWPLMPAEPDLRDDIRKLEDIGTHAPAPFLAVAEALAFHQSIGAERKAARLRYLRDYWLDPLLAFGRVRLLTNRTSACALATIEIDGIAPIDLRNHLWDRHSIRVRPIMHPAVQGIRVSPGLYTSLPELDRFVAVLTEIVRHGLPSG